MSDKISGKFHPIPSPLKISCFFGVFHGNGSHFESKMTAKIQKSPIWAKFGFQVDYDVAN
jgi:hypothetical protein